MLQSMTSWDCVWCIFSISFGGVWLSFCLRLMFLASSGVYLKIRRFATTRHIESEIFLSFGSSPSHRLIIAIFDFTLSFSPSLLNVLILLKYCARSVHFEMREKGADYLRRPMECNGTLHFALFCTIRVILMIFR